MIRPPIFSGVFAPQTNNLRKKRAVVTSAFPLFSLFSVYQLHFHLVGPKKLLNLFTFPLPELLQVH